MKSYHIPLIALLVAILDPCSHAKSTPKADIAKPPFAATPLGQPLAAGVPASDTAKTTPTTNSPTGGLPGLTRSQRTQLHKGVDDPSNNPDQDVARYTGTSVGLVVRAGPAYDEKGQYLGQRVSIVTANEDGVWMSTTMHHSKVLVTVGQTVKAGQEIAIGGGVGDQFKSPKAGKPHVHWELTLDGVSVNPLSGEPLPNPPVKGKTSPGGGNGGQHDHEVSHGHQSSAGRQAHPSGPHSPPSRTPTRAATVSFEHQSLKRHLLQNLYDI